MPQSCILIDKLYARVKQMTAPAVIFALIGIRLSPHGSVNYRH